MLNIPAEVKALFSADVIHKNFHVHFPNGETSDLNNENIVAESVSFTESLCSQQYFKFGLAEASQIQFEAINIPNIRGAYIECAIEIDCSRLGTTWATNHPVDNTLPFLTPQPCNVDGSRYYRVPYGRFVVDTCPRDHGAMYRRQITAYSDTLKDTRADWNAELVKSETMIPFIQNYTPLLPGIVYSYLNNPDLLTANGWTKTLLTGEEYDVRDVLSVDLLDPDKPTVANYLKLEYKTLNYGYSNVGLGLDDFLGVETSRDYDGPSDVEWLRKQILEEFGIDWERTVTNYNAHSGRPAITKEEMVDDFLDSNMGHQMYTGSLWVRIPYRYTNKYGGGEPFELQSIRDEHSIVYMKVGDMRTKPGYGLILGSISTAKAGTVVCTLFNNGTGDVYKTVSITIGATNLYKYTKDQLSDLDSIRLNFEHTLKGKVYSSLTSKTVDAFSHANSWSFTDIIRGFLELSGLFLKPTRSGALDFFEMSANPTAIAIQRSDWSEIWWDETPVDAIGQVKVIYFESGEEQQKTIVIGDGKSVYTMEDNEVLVNAELSDETLQSILDNYFTPNASVVNFTPADISIRGLPYLETGDCIQLTAEDDTEVNTYILEQTITGIQNLRAEITSTNGELLEVIDNE